MTRGEPRARTRHVAGRIVLWALGAGLLAGSGALRADSRGGEGVLPPVECVKRLREARVARMRGDAAAELARLRQAAEAFPDEIAPVMALLEYDHRYGLPKPEHARLEAFVRRRLADPDEVPPVAVLRQVAEDPSAGDDLLGAIAENLSGRVKATHGPPEDLLSLLADLQIGLGRDDEAAGTLERLVDRTSNDLAKLELAWRLYALDAELERWDAVLGLMDRFEELRESAGDGYVTLLAKAGHLDRARAELERLRAAESAATPAVPPPGVGSPAPLTGSDHYTELLEDLAWRYRDAGRDPEAETLFREALARDPDDPQLQAVLLNLYASAEERRAFTASVDKSWQEESDPQALLDEGTQRLATGDNQKAFELLSRAAPSFPSLEAAWFNLGMAAERLERWKTVADALGRAAELNPDRAATFFFRGLALVHLERCSEAVEALERALELDASKGQAHYYLAGCYRELGKAAAAEREQRLYEASRKGS